jgi:hypothetical protein
MPAHLLLLSMGAPPADGINHQQQFDTFLAAWQKGAWKVVVVRCLSACVWGRS